MPWPMVHFSIAEQLWNQNPSPEFLLGSIAPDAIHMREGSTRQDKGRTHLCDDDGTMPSLTDFDNFYRQYVEAMITPLISLCWAMFRIFYRSQMDGDGLERLCGESE